MSEQRYEDLSHTIEDGLITYKGLPAPVICDYLSREEARNHYEHGEEFHIGRINMVANTGTYIDVPFHRYADGKDLAETTIEAAVGMEGVVITVPAHVQEIDETFFEGLSLEGKAVLLYTGWDQYWKTDQYFEGHPYVTAEAAAYLVQQKVALVGIDAVNIDDTSGLARPVHSILLGAEILIVEHLCNLKAIVNSDFRFYALPPKIKGMGTFPVRAMAQVTEQER